MTATQSTDADDVLALATRFFNAIEACDMELVRAIYATEARIWHNYDPLEARFDTAGGGRVVQANIELLSVVPMFIKGMKYELWFQEPTKTGFVRQHVVVGRMRNGAPVRVPVSVIGVVEHGRIIALYEYLDVNHLPADLLQHFASLRATQKD
jgi:ketosteroid isomerase-like protein